MLPAYNEESSILALVTNFDQLVNNTGLSVYLIIVNDGSTDYTIAEVKKYTGKLPMVILDNKTNAGLGKVLKQGLQEALKIAGPEDVIITMDSDNSHNPNQVPQMMYKIEEGNEIVIASRYRPGSEIHGLSQFRKWVSFLAGSLFILFAPIPGVRDYTCGYRAYRSSILSRGFEEYEESLIRETGFSCMVELLLKLNKFKPKVSEIPMILRYDLKLSSSKMKIWTTMKKTIQVLYNYKTGF